MEVSVPCPPACLFPHPADGSVKHRGGTNLRCSGLRAKRAKTYPGKVISTSEAVSPDSRTMLVELQVENSKNEILPGSYATVRVPQVALGKLVTLPDNTLIFRGKSVQVGIVDT